MEVQAFKRGVLCRETPGRMARRTVHLAEKDAKIHREPEEEAHFQILFTDYQSPLFAHPPPEASLSASIFWHPVTYCDEPWDFITILRSLEYDTRSIPRIERKETREKFDTI